MVGRRPVTSWLHLNIKQPKLHSHSELQEPTTKKKNSKLYKHFNPIWKTGELMLLPTFSTPLTLCSEAPQCSTSRRAALAFQDGTCGCCPLPARMGSGLVAMTPEPRQPQSQTRWVSPLAPWVALEKQQHARGLNTGPILPKNVLHVSELCTRIPTWHTYHTPNYCHSYLSCWCW
jgi:hypothetical protein